MEPGYQIVWENGIEYTANLGGVWWYDAEPPPKNHKCWAQTKGITSGLRYVERCACGSFGPEPFLMLGNDKPRVKEEPSFLRRLCAKFT